MLKLFKVIWMGLAEVLGLVNTAILLGVVYFVTLGPTRLFAILGRDDAMGERAGGPSFWKPKKGLPPGMDLRRRLRFQF